MEIDDVLTSRLRPFLMRVGNYDNVMNVVERVFQRAPDIVQEIRDAMDEEEIQSSIRTQIVKKSTLLDIVCDKVMEYSSSFKITE